MLWRALRDGVVGWRAEPPEGPGGGAGRETEVDGGASVVRGAEPGRKD